MTTLPVNCKTTGLPHRQYRCQHQSILLRGEVRTKATECEKGLVSGGSHVLMAEQGFAYRRGETESMVSKPTPSVGYAAFSFVLGGFLVLGAALLHPTPEPVASALWL